MTFSQFILLPTASPLLRPSAAPRCPLHHSTAAPPVHLSTCPLLPVWCVPWADAVSQRRAYSCCRPRCATSTLPRSPPPAYSIAIRCFIVLSLVFVDQQAGPLRIPSDLHSIPQAHAPHGLHALHVIPQTQRHARPHPPGALFSTTTPGQQQHHHQQQRRRQRQRWQRLSRRYPSGSRDSCPRLH